MERMRRPYRGVAGLRTDREEGAGAGFWSIPFFIFWRAGGGGGALTIKSEGWAGRHHVGRSRSPSLVS